MTRACISLLSVSAVLAAASPAPGGIVEQGDMREAGPPDSSRNGDYFEITARGGMLIGGEGRTGDAMRYRGEHVWSGPGTATVSVRERNNTGVVIGNVRTNGHTYTVMMNRFRGDRPYQSGGIAKFIDLHGLTRRGEPILPKTFAYLAGWGSPCTVWKDADILYDDVECRFMLTEQVRDPDTGAIHDFPSRGEVREILRGTRWQGDYQRNREIKERIRRSGSPDRHGLQLHLFAHAPERNFGNLPPYETAMHFVWNDVRWWRGPRGPVDGRRREADRALERTVRRQLKLNAMIDPQDVQVSVRNGRVTLTGIVDSAIEKNQAYVSAWAPGATSVRNDIDVQADEPPTDRELEKALAQAYALDPRVTHRRPLVTVEDGVLTLSGTVADREARRAAEEVARQIEGVSEVRNRLKIDETLSQREPEDIDAVVRSDVAPPTPGMSRADRKLRRAIESELTWSPHVDADRVDVTVRDGVAYLFGSVEDRNEMDAAIDNAFQAGAERVVNLLTTPEPEEPDRPG